MTARQQERWDADFAVKHGLVGFDAFLQVQDPELAEFNRVWEAEVAIAAELLVLRMMKEAA